MQADTPASHMRRELSTDGANKCVLARDGDDEDETDGRTRTDAADGRSAGQDIEKEEER